MVVHTWRVVGYNTSVKKSTLTPFPIVERELSSREVAQASHAMSPDRNPRRSATPECGPRGLFGPDRTVLDLAKACTVPPPEQVESLWFAPFHRRTPRARYTVQRSEMTRRDKLDGSLASLPTPMAVPAMGFDLLVTFANRPSTPAGVVRPRLRRVAVGVWEASPPSTRPGPHHRSPLHLGSKRENEGYDVVRQLPSTCE